MQTRSLSLNSTGETGGSYNKIKDVSPIAKLDKLKLLFLGGNKDLPVSDWKKLSGRLAEDFRGPNWKEKRAF